MYRLEAIPDSTLINSPDEIPFKGCVTGLGCIESSYLCQSCPCINDYHNLDLAPLLVCIKYLTQLEVNKECLFNNSKNISLYI